MVRHTGAPVSAGDRYFFVGTFLPARLASERPMAIACFLLFTVLPLPLFSLPLLNSCISLSTFSPADGEYLRDEDFFAEADFLPGELSEDFPADEDFLSRIGFVAIPHS